MQQVMQRWRQRLPAPAWPRATCPIPGTDVAANAEEIRLLQAARSGSVAALEQLLARHEPGLLALCRGVLNQAEDAEDAVQETFLRALRALPTFRGEAGLRTWLFRIALNVCLERKRGRAARPATVPLQDVSFAAASPSPEGSTLRHLRIAEALATLEPRHRAVLLLKEWEGWSAPEIARALGCSPRRVYHELTLAHRALADWRARQIETDDLTGEPDR